MTRNYYGDKQLNFEDVANVMTNGTEGNLKVPSQVFRWFEKMKNNYETSVQSVLSRFEEYNNKQQNRLDSANKEHIYDLKAQHQQQLEQSQNNIEHLHNDIKYYKDQIAQQQRTIEQLNTRYDAVMSCLLSEKSRNKNQIKDIFDNEDFFTEINEELPKPSQDMGMKMEGESSSNASNVQENIKKSINQPFDRYDSPNDINLNRQDSTKQIQAIFEQALELRSAAHFQQAFELFQQCAQAKHAHSMGAMGRSYFLGEGVEENHELGLAWLIKAANEKLPQAVSRVEHFQLNDPELFLSANKLVDDLS
ncbi:hypothetical protein AADZ91_13735 [Colwelliaceae bacterium 6441]